MLKQHFAVNKIVATLLDTKGCCRDTGNMLPETSNMLPGNMLPGVNAALC